MVKKNKNISIRASFGDTIFKLAQTNHNIYVVSADLKSSLFLTKFTQNFLLVLLNVVSPNPTLPVSPLVLPKVAKMFFCVPLLVFPRVSTGPLFASLFVTTNSMSKLSALTPAS